MIYVKFALPLMALSGALFVFHLTRELAIERACTDLGGAYLMGTCVKADCVIKVGR